jgi:hypothetical protein
VRTCEYPAAVATPRAHGGHDGGAAQRRRNARGAVRREGTAPRAVYCTARLAGLLSRVPHTRVPHARVPLEPPSTSAPGRTWAHPGSHGCTRDGLGAPHAAHLVEHRWPLRKAHARLWLHLPLQRTIKYATGYNKCNGVGARAAAVRAAHVRHYGHTVATGSSATAPLVADAPTPQGIIA